MRHNDTISAVATPPGSGGVGIVRVSGPHARDIARAVFRPSRDSFTNFKPYVMHHGTLVDTSGRTLDEVLAVFMPGPGSYTGQDTIEFHCHGGRAVMAAVLEETLVLGARMAERGEFTKRAFLNGKLDLTQAEAVAETIAAPSKAALHLAQVKLSGVLGLRVKALRRKLEGLRAKMVVAVDFPEDEVECCPPEEIAQEAAETVNGIDSLLEGVERTRMWREGALAVLAGPVNAGKSSLMNGLLGRDRAIVTPLPGTTRDYLEETLNIKGLPVRLVDTAGLRDTDDAAELAGLKMSRELAERADLVLAMTDGSTPLEPELLELAERFTPDRVLCLVNKSDMDRAEPDPAEIFKKAGFECMEISAKLGTGIDRLAERMGERLSERRGEPDPDEPAPNARQARALTEAREEISELARDLQSGMPYDLLTLRLDAGISILGEITGQIAPEETLNAIFDDFCIGK